MLCCTSPQAGRRFSDILMCQAEPNGSVVANVKDMFLAGGSTTPMFDSSVVSNIQDVVALVFSRQCD